MAGPGMDIHGMNLDAMGAQIDVNQLIELRKRKGQCVTCGRQTHSKKMFKLHPLTVAGEVLEGRCLRCDPLEFSSFGSGSSRLLGQRAMASSRNIAGGIPQASSVAAGSHAGHPRERRSLPNLAASPTPRRNPSGYSVSHRTFGGGPPQSQHWEADSRGSVGSGSSGHDTAASGRRWTKDPTSSPVHAGPGHGGHAGPSGGRMRSTRGLGTRGASKRLVSSVQSERRLDRGGQIGEDKDSLTQRRVASAEEVTQEDKINSTRSRREHSRSSRDQRSADAGSSASRSPRPRRLSSSNPHRTSAHDLYAGTDTSSQGSSRDLRSEASTPPPDNRPRPTLVNDLSNRSIRSTCSDISAGSHHSSSDRFAESRAEARNSTPPTYRVGVSSEHSRNGEAEGGPPSYDDLKMPPTYDDLKMPPTYKTSSSPSGRKSSSRRGKSPKRGMSPKRETRSFREQPDQNHSKSPQQQQQPSADESVRVIRQATSARDVLVHMMEFPNSGAVQREACQKLCSLDPTPEESTAMLREGGLVLVTDAMRNHAGDASLQDFSCRVLCNFSSSASQRVEIANSGGVDCVVAAMNDFPDNGDLQEKACAALSNLSTSDDLHSLIVNSGGIEAVVKAMNEHSLNADVQERACYAVVNLAASENHSIKEAIAAAKGIDAICISMVMHPTNATVQEIGCKALRKICADDDRNRQHTEMQGGIDAVISAMQIHRGEAAVQKEGCWLLTTLAANTDNKMVIGESNGADVIVRAMWVHSEDPDLQDLACEALLSLTEYPENISMIVQVGGIAAIVSAMQGFTDVALIQQKGCACLEVLAASSDQTRGTIVEGEGIDVIVMAMVLHPDDSLLQQTACNAIQALAFEPHLEALRAQVPPLLEQAAQRFPSSCGRTADYVLNLL